MIRKYFQDSAEACLVLDATGRVSVANTQAHGMCPRESRLVGREWTALFVTRSMRSRVKQEFLRFLAVGTGKYEIECKLPGSARVGGGIVWSHVACRDEITGGTVVLSTGRDIASNLKEREERQVLLASSSALYGRSFFDHLVKAVSLWLGADGVLFGRITDQGRRVESISYYLDRKHLRGIRYPLEGTPCADTLKTWFLHYPESVCLHYPKATNLSRLKMEGYVGLPLRGARGEVIGLLVAVSRRRLELPVFARETLPLIAARLASDLERCDAREDLVRSERRFRELFFNAPIAYQSLDVRGRILNVNQAWLDMLGYTREEVIGRPYIEILPRNKRGQFPCSFSRMKKMGGLRGAELELEHKSGRRLLVSVDGNVVMDAQGRFSRTYCMLTDITERRKAENALEEERKKLTLSLEYEKIISGSASQLNSSESFQNTIDEILLVLGDKLWLDSAGFYSFDEPAGTAVRLSLWVRVESALKKLLPESIQLSRYERLFKRILGGRDLIIDDIASVPDRNHSGLAVFGGSAIYVCPLVIAGLTKGFLVFLRRGTVRWAKEEIGALRVISDLIVGAWERHSHFQALLESERGRVEAVRLAEESARLASIGVLAAGITHEINQPLNAIKITTDSILLWIQMNQGLLPEEFGDWLQLIPAHVNRIVEIIQQMRSYWVPTEKAEVRELNLNESIRKALSLVDTQLYNHGIHLDIRLAAGELVLVGNAIHLEQVLINLVVNAMQALDTEQHRDKWIRVSTRRRQQRIILKVEDNGPGFKIPNVEKIFDPFYSTKRQGTGSGLGLAIVRRFVTEHGGSITAANGKKAGAVFTISLPAWGKED
ncbi:PAS domain S-box protein [bacterium]|nr:PAS domain S-box protein [bacterium]